mmetsp:Transcript_19888/g.22197  ORF Transcript_19888/g.22197 Transcript_19888/m.22197 type:complete len:149 (+) Transcript_19888:414-860(+)
MERNNSSESFNHPSNEVPGPGHYKSTQDINPEGQYCSSKFKNVKSLPYLPSGKRFKEKRSDVPGPGKYDPTQNYFLQANKTKKKPFGFGKDSRKSMAIKEIIKNPGPGSYDLPGAFSPSDEYYNTKTRNSHLSRKMKGSVTDRGPDIY